MSCCLFFSFWSTVILSVEEFVNFDSISLLFYRISVLCFADSLIISFYFEAFFMNAFIFFGYESNEFFYYYSINYCILVCYRIIYVKITCSLNRSSPGGWSIDIHTIPSSYTIYIYHLIDIYICMYIKILEKKRI